MNKRISASMRERKRLRVNLELKSLDNEGRFAGYASVFAVVDNQKDIMQKGAFTGSLQGRLSEIKFLWQHHQDEPIGILERMFEDAHGLYVEGRLLLGVQRGHEAFTLLKAGAISGLSIGYSPVRYRIDAQTGVRLLAEVDLFEVSLVTFPANQAATVTVVKSLTPPNGGVRCNPELIQLQDALDNALLALSTAKPKNSRI